MSTARRLEPRGGSVEQVDHVGEDGDPLAVDVVTKAERVVQDGADAGSLVRGTS